MAKAGTRAMAARLVACALGRSVCGSLGTRVQGRRVRLELIRRREWSCAVMERRWVGVPGTRGAVRDAVTPKLAQKKRKWGRQADDRRHQGSRACWAAMRELLCAVLTACGWRCLLLLSGARVGRCSRLKLVPGGAGGQRIGCGLGWGSCDAGEPRVRYVRDLLAATLAARGEAGSWELGAGSWEQAGMRCEGALARRGWLWLRAYRYAGDVL